MSKLAVAAVAATLAGCSLPDAPPPPTVTTLFDVQALYAANNEPSYRVAVDSSLPGGIPIGDMMSRDGVLKLHPTFADGYPAAYVVTDVWTDFDEIWVQPAYVPVKGWQSGAPQRLTMPWQPIFSVSPGSRFYSPFWQIVYVGVPDETTPETLTSAEQVRDSGYPLFPDLGSVMAMHPGNVTLETLTLAGHTVPAGGAEFRQGWLEGKPGSYVEFQSADLRWNDKLVVDEVPIYHFVARNNDGSLVQLPIPTVAGTGPPYSNTPPPIFLNPDGVTLTSHYAGYWRLYTVILPPDARVFTPPVRSDLSDEIRAQAPDFPLVTTYPDPSITNATEPDVRGLAGLVALTPSCFDAALGTLALDNYPQPCQFLDSQQNIERYLPPALIQRTNVTVTCPFVSFRDMEVSP